MMMGYKDTIRKMGLARWFRVWENDTYIHFARRTDSGAFEYKTVRYDKECDNNGN